MFKKVLLFFLNFLFLIQCANSLNGSSVREFHLSSRPSYASQNVHYGIRQRGPFRLPSNRTSPEVNTHFFTLGHRGNSGQEQKVATDGGAHSSTEDFGFDITCEQYAHMKREKEKVEFELAIVHMPIKQRNKTQTILCHELQKKRAAITVQQKRLSDTQKYRKKVETDLKKLERRSCVVQFIKAKQIKITRSLQSDCHENIKKYEHQILALESDIAQIEDKVQCIEQSIQRDAKVLNEQLDVLALWCEAQKIYDQTSVVQARLGAIEQTRAEGGVVHEVEYVLTQEAEGLLYQFDIPVEHFKKGVGNAFQNQIVQENVDIIHDLADVRIKLANKSIEEYVKAVAHFSHAAMDMNNAGELRDAVVFTDIARNLLGMVSGYVKKAAKVGVGVVKGAVKGACDIIRFPVELILFPEETLESLLHTFVYLTQLNSEVNRPSFGGFRMPTVSATASGEPSEFGIQLEPATEKLVQMCEHFLSLPLEEQAEGATRLLTAIVGPVKIARVTGLQRGIQAIGNIIGRELSGMRALLAVETAEIVEIAGVKMPYNLAKDILKQQKKAGRAFGKAEVAQKIKAGTQQAQVMAKDVGVAVNSAVKKGAQKTADVVRSGIKKVPGITKVHHVYKENQLYKILEKLGDRILLRQYRDVLPFKEIRVRLDEVKHFLGLEITTKIKKSGKIRESLSGFHHNFKGYVTKDIAGLDILATTEEGLIQGLIKRGGKTFDEIKTQFPQHWPQEKVVAKTYEAAKNMIKQPELQPRGSWKIIGKTAEGIIIELITTAKGRLVTAYPHLDNFIK